MAYTIITGASSGIGKSLATACARRGRDLILVSLPEEDLAGVAASLEENYGVQAEYYETDLTANGSVDDFYAWCRKEDWPIDMLINNAGVGRQGKFELSSHGEIRSMMQLNMEAVASMCWGGISFLKQQPRSHILNVGSVGSFTPVPYKAVYTASKHFVLAFSNALYYELKESPISVGCLCPGPTITKSVQREKVAEQGWKGRMLTLSADEVAEAAMEGILDGKRVIIPGFANKIFKGLSWILPLRLRLRLAGAIFADSTFNES